MNKHVSLSDDNAAKQKDILDRGCGWEAYHFAKNIPGADIQSLQQVVIERGDGCDAYWFAKDINGADVEALQDVVTKDCDSEWVPDFARDIAGADVEALQKHTMEKGDGRSLYYFAKDVKGADLRALHNRLVDLNSIKQDVDSKTGKGRYLDVFNNDTDIQDRLKEQLDAVHSASACGPYAKRNTSA